MAVYETIKACNCCMLFLTNVKIKQETRKYRKTFAHLCVRLCECWSYFDCCCCCCWAVVVAVAANVLECLLHPSVSIKKHLFMVIK